MNPKTAITLDVDRLLLACSRVGLKLFALQARAIAREYARLSSLKANR